MGKKKRRRKIR